MAGNRLIGTKLRELREQNGLSVNEVLELLNAKGIEISNKSFYSYENNSRAISTETFLALCAIYDVKNVLDTFGNEEIDYSIPTDKEWEMIEKYRALDNYGMQAVDSVLGVEYDRCLTPAVMDNVRPIRYYQRTASAGPGQVLFDDIPVDLIEIPDIDDYRRVAYAVGVNGDSMEPEYHDSDILLVEPAVNLMIGEIGIFYVDGNTYVKELGHGELLSFNPDYDPIPLNEDSRCMGRVVGKL